MRVLKYFTIFLIGVLINKLVIAQEVKSVTIIKDSSINTFSKYLVQTPLYKFIFNSFGSNGTATTRDITVNSSTLNGYTLVTVYDTSDHLVNSFTISMIINNSKTTPNSSNNNLITLNDSSFLLFQDLFEDFYLDTIKLFSKKIEYTQFGKRVLQIDKNGTVKLIANLDITSSGNPDNNGAFTHPTRIFKVSPDKTFLYALYNTVTDFDSTIFDTNIFKIGRTSILRFTIANGQLDKYWLVSEVFDRLDLTDTDIILAGYTPRLKPFYSIDSLIYPKDTSDKSRCDIVIAGIAKSDGKLKWHQIIKSASTSLILYVGNGVPYLILTNRDTLRFNGQLFGKINNGLSYLFVRLNMNGTASWSKLIQAGNPSVYEISTFNNNELWLTLNCDKTDGFYASNFKYDGKYYPRTSWGLNYFRINPSDGSVITNMSIYPFKSYNANISGHYVSGSDSTYYTLIKLSNTDSLLINGVYYTKKNKSTYSHEYLLLYVKAYSKVNPIKDAIISPLSNSRIKLNWKLDSSYNNNLMNVVVFLKKGSPINDGVNSIDPLNYTVNPDFSGFSSIYPNDSLAKVVYFGDSTQIQIYGLEDTTKYYALIYVVREYDYLYSNSFNCIGKTLNKYILPHSSLTFTDNGNHKALIRWKREANYIDEIMSTIVFVKEANPINNIDSNFKLGASYLPNQVFGAGAKLNLDTMAFCVYNGDDSLVTVSNLKYNVTYYIISYSSRITDSINSVPINGYGSIIIDTFSTFTLAEPFNNSSMVLQGDTTQMINFNWVKPIINFDSIQVNYKIQFDTTTQFTNDFFIFNSSNNGIDSTFRISVVQMSKLFNLKLGDTKNVFWRVKANVNTFSRLSDTFTLIINRGRFDYISEIQVENGQDKVFPNPSNGIININLTDVSGNLEIVDLLGNVQFSKNGYLNGKVDLSLLPKGLYTLKITTGNKLFSNKLLLE